MIDDKRGGGCLEIHPKELHNILMIRNNEAKFHFNWPSEAFD
jgi:hypothetical protein